MTQRYRWVYGAMQMLKRHAGAIFTGGSALSLPQRYQFLSGWLPWISDGLGMVVTIMAIVWTLLMWVLPRFPRTYLIALVISHPTSIVFAYLTNKYLAFRTKGSFFGEFMKFSTFYLLNFGANLAVLPVAVEGLHLPPIPCQLAFAGIVMVSSYFWHSRITFRRKAVSVAES